MTPTRFQLAACVFFAVTLAGCSSTPMPTPAADSATPARAAQATPGAPPTAASTAGLGPAKAPAIAGLPPHRDPSHPISRERSVYFDYDDDSLLPQWRGVVERQARYLASQPELPVQVQGNTDERGGREYNLALGQRRAEAVRRALLILGVRAAQVEAVSLGEERPKAEGQDEAAWQQNRRADILYPAGR